MYFILVSSFFVVLLQFHTFLILKMHVYRIQNAFIKAQNVHGKDFSDMCWVEDPFVCMCVCLCVSVYYVHFNLAYMHFDTIYKELRIFFFLLSRRVRVKSSSSLILNCNSITLQHHHHHHPTVHTWISVYLEWLFEIFFLQDFFFCLLLFWHTWEFTQDWAIVLSKEKKYWNLLPKRCVEATTTVRIRKFFNVNFMKSNDMEKINRFSHFWHIESSIF